MPPPLSPSTMAFQPSSITAYMETLKRLGAFNGYGSAKLGSSEKGSMNASSQLIPKAFSVENLSQSVYPATSQSVNRSIQFWHVPQQCNLYIYFSCTYIYGKFYSGPKYACTLCSILLVVYLHIGWVASADSEIKLTLWWRNVHLLFLFCYFMILNSV